jgi:hypothetical protein
MSLTHVSEFHTFYSVQGLADAARLARGGEPWPTGLQKANISRGFYAWETRADAERYLARLREQGLTDLQIVSYRIANDDLTKLKTLDMRNMSDDAINDWMAMHSRYGSDHPEPHGYQYVIRNTGMGAPEHYFSSEVFHLSSEALDE